MPGPLFTPKPPVREIKVYAHNDKDSNWNQWETDLGQPANDAGRRFAYCAYEVEFDCTVDIRTGTVMCQGVNGVPLEKEIELT
jgi:hypothetical protein